MICFPCLVVGLFSQDFIGGTQQRDPIGLKHVDAAHLWELFFFPKNSQHIIARSYESPYTYLQLWNWYKKIFSDSFLKITQPLLTVTHGLLKRMMVSLGDGNVLLKSVWWYHYPPVPTHIKSLSPGTQAYGGERFRLIISYVHLLPFQCRTPTSSREVEKKWLLSVWKTFTDGCSCKPFAKTSVSIYKD